ncbi:MAG: HIT domain-containing protein [Rhodothermales bacterium]|nr:HIT domain-containing protein [Rhodothermales bacterium]
MKAVPGADMDTRSLFARLAAEDEDEKNYIVWRGVHVFVIMNLYPYNNGHLLIVPYRTVAAYEELSRDEQIELAVTLDQCIRWLNEALCPEGFNVGMNLGKAAGAGIPDHLHLHVVPRWQGDTNFMPTIGEVKVLPEALDVTYRKLVAAARAGATAFPQAG